MDKDTEETLRRLVLAAFALVVFAAGPGLAFLYFWKWVASESRMLRTEALTPPQEVSASPPQPPSGLADIKKTQPPLQSSSEMRSYGRGSVSAASKQAPAQRAAALKLGHHQGYRHRGHGRRYHNHGSHHR